MLIGTLCWAFYKVTAEAIPAYASKSDQVFPYFITTHVPPGSAGLFLAGLFGAAMANLSSDFNSLAAVFVEDYYRVWKPQSNDRQRLTMGKIVVAVCGCLCVVIAIVLAQTSGSALSLWYTVSASFQPAWRDFSCWRSSSTRRQRSGPDCHRCLPTFHRMGDALSARVPVAYLYDRGGRTFDRTVWRGFGQFILSQS